MAARSLPSPLLTVLGPVHRCLHPFLDDGDAARVLRVSRSVAMALLSGYAFASHVFHPSSAAHVQQTTALYERYGLRVTRMSLPYDFQEPLQEERKSNDDGMGASAPARRSILPSSLVALVMGEVDPSRSANSLFPNIPALTSIGELRVDTAPLADGDDEYQRLLHRVDHRTSWRLEPYASACGEFQRCIPPGALPQGLRFLQLPHDFSEPLERGSIPSSVTFLQFGYHWKRRIGRGVLPSSLTHLLLGYGATEPFRPGELPSSLLQLHLGGYNVELEEGTLPSSLRCLDMGERSAAQAHPSAAFVQLSASSLLLTSALLSAAAGTTSRCGPVSFRPRSLTSALATSSIDLSCPASSPTASSI